MNQNTSDADYCIAQTVSCQKTAHVNQGLTLVNTLRTMASIHFEGNIKPHAWFKHIRFSNGKPDSIAMDLLSEIVYWYRPETKKKEQTGETVAYRKKFKSDKLQRSIGSFSDQFGYTKRQVSEALGRLEKLGLIDREYRTINTAVGKLPNVLYIGINAVAIQSISYDDLAIEEDAVNDDETNDYLVFETTQDRETSPPKNSPSLERHIDRKTSTPEVLRSVRDGQTPMCDGTTPNAIGTTFYVRPSHTERDTSHIERSTYTETTTEITTAAASNERREKDEDAFIAAAAKINKTIFTPKSFTPMEGEDSLIGNTLTSFQRDTLQKRVAQLELSDEVATILFKQLEAGLLDCEYCFTKCGRDFYHKLNAMLKSVREGSWTPPASLQLHEKTKKETQTNQKRRALHALWMAWNQAVNHVNDLKRDVAAAKDAPYYPDLVQQHEQAASHLKMVQDKILTYCPETNFNQIQKDVEEKFYA